MRQFDIRDELEKYIQYLQRIRLQAKPEVANAQEDVIKSLKAILAKTERTIY